jgi:hypothetical protein
MGSATAVLYTCILPSKCHVERVIPFQLLGESRTNDTKCIIQHVAKSTGCSADRNIFLTG